MIDRSAFVPTLVVPQADEEDSHQCHRSKDTIIFLSVCLPCHVSHRHQSILIVITSTMRVVGLLLLLCCEGEAFVSFGRRRTTSLLKADQDLFRTVALEDPEWFEEFVLGVLGEDELDADLVALVKERKANGVAEVSSTFESVVEEIPILGAEEVVEVMAPSTTESDVLHTHENRHEALEETQEIRRRVETIEDSAVEQEMADEAQSTPDSTALPLVEEAVDTVGATDSGQLTPLSDEEAITDGADAVTVSLPDAQEEGSSEEPDATETASDPILSNSSVVTESEPTEDDVETTASEANGTNVSEIVESTACEDAETPTNSTTDTVSVSSSLDPVLMSEPVVPDTSKHLDATPTESTDSQTRVESGPMDAVPNAKAEEPTDSETVRYRDPSSTKMKQVRLQQIVALGYSREEVLSLQTDALDLIVCERIERPRSGVPKRWKTEGGFNPDLTIGSGSIPSESETPTKSMQSETTTRPRVETNEEFPFGEYTAEPDVEEPYGEFKVRKRAQRKEDRETSQPRRRRRDEPLSRVEGDESLRTRRESRRRDQESGEDFETDRPRREARRRRDRASEERPIYDGRPKKPQSSRKGDPPPGSSGMWPDMPTFRELLRNEADFRLRILGDGWSDVVREESDWRLGLYRDWLWLLNDGVGDPIVETRTDRMRRLERKRTRAKSEGAPESRRRSRR